MRTASGFIPREMWTVLSLAFVAGAGTFLWTWFTWSGTIQRSTSWIYAARLALVDGNYEEAAESAHARLKESPRDLEAGLVLALAAERASAGDESVEHPLLRDPGRGWRGLLSISEKAAGAGDGEPVGALHADSSGWDETGERRLEGAAASEVAAFYRGWALRGLGERAAGEAVWRELVEGLASREADLSGGAAGLLSRTLAVMGDHGGAMEALETAVLRGWRGAPQARFMPAFDGLYEKPRFRALTDSGLDRFGSAVRRLMADGEMLVAFELARLQTRLREHDEQGWLFLAFAAERLPGGADTATAERAWRKILGLVGEPEPGATDGLHARGWALWGLGRRVEARAVWRELSATYDPSPGFAAMGIGAYNRACYLSLAGAFDEAILAMRESLEGGYTDYGWAEADPDLMFVHDDPRFIELMASARSKAREGR